jgi:glycosyltransferase involved in cell wall biosynthesis
MKREKCKSVLGLSGFTVGYVGRLVERKGLMDMIEALPMCPAEMTMLFAGAGEFRAALERRALELGRRAQVRFVPARSIEELPQVMNALDALILPSWTVPSWKEQFGRVIIEERNPAALAVAISHLKANPAQTREMGRAGRLQVERNFTWRRVAEQMRDIYLHCMELEHDGIAMH